MLIETDRKRTLALNRNGVVSFVKLEPNQPNRVSSEDWAQARKTLSSLDGRPILDHMAESGQIRVLTESQAQALLQGDVPALGDGLFIPPAQAAAQAIPVRVPAQATPPATMPAVSPPVDPAVLAAAARASAAATAAHAAAADPERAVREAQQRRKG